MKLHCKIICIVYDVFNILRKCSRVPDQSNIFRRMEDIESEDIWENTQKKITIAQKLTYNYLQKLSFK